MSAPGRCVGLNCTRVTGFCRSVFYSMRTLHAIGALTGREVLKFLRDRSRVLGALAQPLVLWLLLGLGLQGTFRPPSGVGFDGGYVEFLFPGILALVLLFTAIFSTISVVEERTSGFLQAVLVAPTAPTALVLGIVLGGTVLATGQALLFLVAVPLLDLQVSFGGLILVGTVCVLTGLAFTALGFGIAWRMSTTRGFHAVMNLGLLPLWFLSGAMFPVEGAASVLRAIIWANPVSYAVSGLRHGLHAGTAPATLAGPAVCLVVTATFAVLMLGFAVWQVQRPFFETD